MTVLVFAIDGVPLRRQCPHDCTALHRRRLPRA